MEGRMIRTKGVSTGMRVVTISRVKCDHTCRGVLD